MIRFLPESHTDFVFSASWPAIALGLGLLALLSFIVIRALLRATRMSNSGRDADR